MSGATGSLGVNGSAGSMGSNVSLRSIRSQVLRSTGSNLIDNFTAKVGCENIIHWPALKIFSLYYASSVLILNGLVFKVLF